MTAVTSMLPTTTKSTSLVGTLGLGLAAAAAWLVVLSPQTSALGEAEERVTAANDRNDALSLQIATLRAQEANLDELRGQTAALTTKFPASADQPGLFQQIGRAAQDAGIATDKVTVLTSSAPVLPDPAAGTAAGGTAATSQEGAAAAQPAPTVASQSVSVTVEASRAQVQALLASLEQMPRAYLMTSLSLGVGSQPGAVTATISGEMFVMPAAPDPAEG